jgi:hypothetical protein
VRPVGRARARVVDRQLDQRATQRKCLARESADRVEHRLDARFGIAGDVDRVDRVVDGRLAEQSERRVEQELLEGREVQVHRASRDLGCVRDLRHRRRRPRRDQPHRRVDDGGAGPPALAVAAGFVLGCRHPWHALSAGFGVRGGLTRWAERSIHTCSHYTDV